MAIWSGEVKCSNCGIWLVPFKYCSSCGHQFSGNTYGGSPSELMMRMTEIFEDTTAPNDDRIEAFSLITNEKFIELARSDREWEAAVQGDYCMIKGGYMDTKKGFEIADIQEELADLYKSLVAARERATNARREETMILDDINKKQKEFDDIVSKYRKDATDGTGWKEQRGQAVPT